MGEKLFEREYKVHYYETDRKQNLRVRFLLNYFEEISLLQSESLGVGLDFYKKNGVIWVLHKLDIHFKRFPRFNEILRIITQPVSVYGFMGFRNFQVLDSRDEELIWANSSWLFISTSGRRPLRVSDEVKKAYGHFNSPEKKQDMAAVPPLIRPDASKTFSVRYADIDINKHVNNACYAEWAFEPLPEELYLQYGLKRLQVEFKKETKFTDDVKSQVQIDPDQNGYLTLHKITGSGDHEKCRMACYWENPEA